MKRFGYELLSALLLVGVVFAEQRSQVFSVNGNVRTVERPVSYASVTFIDKNDSTICYVTGNGLKATEVLMEVLSKPEVMQADVAKISALGR